MPVDMVSPRVEWIFYNEPEGHLDNVVKTFAKLENISEQSKIFGLTYKEDTTIERLNKLGYSNTFRFDVVNHFDLSKSAGLEKIQHAVNPEFANTIKAESGLADLLFARHILEHAHDPVKFTSALKSLIDKGKGYIVFEVPDSQRFMSLNDYPFIWEEHISYFTEETLEQFMVEQGLEVIEIDRYPYTFEDSLVVITKICHNHTDKSQSGVQSTRALAESFSSTFDTMKSKVQETLLEYKRAEKRVGIFGAGHLAVKFLNFFELGQLIDVVLDDHPKKQGMFMPGSGTPIVSTDQLKEIDLCLLSLSPESEHKIMQKFDWYEDGNRVFRSIFAASPISIFND